MANQNLSQFGENTSVSDADYTFVWDSANSISKKVSRNSWLNSGTLTSSAPVTISQTWNGTGSTVFCAIKSVITDTNSAAGSDFLELYSGTSTQPLRMDINKTGQINIYGTWTDASNYERLSFSAPTAGNAIIGTNKSGGSSVARGLDFQTNGTSRWSISTNGDFVPLVNNAYDIGTQGGPKAKNLFLAGAAAVDSTYLQYTSTSGGMFWNNGGPFITWARMSAPAIGVLTIDNGVFGVGRDFNRLQFGGTTSSFPSLKRVGAELQVVIASTTAAINVAAGDADLTFIEDRYRRKGAGDPNGTVIAPIGAVYHNTTGGANTSFYVKESSPTPNTGWVGK